MKKTERNILESKVKEDVMLHGPTLGMTLFNNPVGLGYVGELIDLVTGGIKQRLLRVRARIMFGLVKGSSDVIGWTTLTITPEMVGKQIAVFTGIETKTATGKERDAQENFRRVLTAAGGLATVARCNADVEKALAEFCERLTL